MYRPHIHYSQTVTVMYGNNISIFSPSGFTLRLPESTLKLPFRQACQTRGKGSRVRWPAEGTQVVKTTGSGGDISGACLATALVPFSAGGSHFLFLLDFCAFTDLLFRLWSEDHCWMRERGLPSLCFPLLRGPVPPRRPLP